MNLGQLIVSILTTNNFSYWYLFFILLLAIITLTICYSIKIQNQHITNCLKNNNLTANSPNFFNFSSNEQEYSSNKLDNKISDILFPVKNVLIKGLLI
ncbi:hypothetical protein NMYAN_10264 [Nitrosomonas nitrosa]|uniref:Uncharacterized protein n=1 Tax=Nitrosomonas nitrosa TaxID=52442 RepID=A0A8H8YXX2_9PROT|nr:hypothetical protein NMYAN_10264 [Nitrosomonas nitrosa]